MGDHGDMGDHSKPTQGGFCDFTAIDNVEEGRGYTVAGIETSEEGILKIEFEDKDAAVGIALEGEPSFDFDCVNGICTSQKPVPAGTYSVQVTNPFAEEPFNDLWEAIPYIRTYYVDGVNYCGGKILNQSQNHFFQLNFVSFRRELAAHNRGYDGPWRHG